MNLSFAQTVRMSSNINVKLVKRRLIKLGKYVLTAERKNHIKRKTKHP